MVDIHSVSKKWCEEILYALKDGAKRFNELMKSSGNSKMINSRTLADRLKELEEQKLVVREILQERPPASNYKLTDKGRKAVELIIKLRKL